jgi:hypothetical protein
MAGGLITRNKKITVHFSKSESRLSFYPVSVLPFPFPKFVLVAFCLAALVAGKCLGQGTGSGGAGIDEAQVEAAMADGRYGEALDLLKPLDVAGGKDAFLLRWKAFCLVAVERFDEALAVADRLLELDGADSYAAFYRAQALAGLDKMAAASQQLAQVIEDNAGSEAAQLVESELPEFAESGELPTAEAVGMALADRDLSASLSLGVGYDDNVALVPEGGSLASGQASAYVQTQLALDYRLIDQGEGALPLSLFAGGGFYRSQYFDNGLDELDYMIADPRLGLRHQTRVSGHDLAVDVGGFYRHAWLGDSDYYDAWGVSASVDYAITPGIHARAVGEWTTTTFGETPPFPTYFDRDGDTWSATAAVSAWMFGNRVWLDTGYTYELEDASGIQLAYDQHRGFARTYIDLPAKFRLGLGTEYGNPDYQLYIPEPSRQDEGWQFFALLQRPLFVPELTGSLSWTHIRNRSNQNFADYDRNLFLFQITWAQ